MSAPVFITHSSRDYKQSRAVVDVLEKNGIGCWISERDIGAGDNYGDAIVDAIENAKAMVLVFSANANSSDEIKKEIALASQRKLTVVPIRIEDATPSKAFRYELITRNWIDAFADWNQAMETLTRRVSAIVGADVNLPEPLPKPKPKPAIPPAWIAAAVAGIAIIGTGVAYGLWPRPQPPAIVVHNDDTTHQKPAPAPQPQAATAKPAADNAPVVAQGDETAPVVKPVPAPQPQTAPTKPAADRAPVVAQGGEAAPAVNLAPMNTVPAVKLTPPASPSASKKTVVAALIPIMPVEKITPPKPAPAKPNAPAIAVKPPPYNVATPGGQVFQECKNCPQMVVVPRGAATLGTPAGEPGRQSNEVAPHGVTIAAPFAVGRYDVTFDEWDACLADGGCNGYRPDDNGFGRGKRPVIFVSWNDANAYVKWLKSKTGAPYRLLSEAEWEYAARGCTTAECPNTPFWFGDISPELANYDSRYSYEGSTKADRALETVPVDQGKPNPFGLYNMLGNVQQWLEDCWNAELDSPPSDGSPVLTGDCSARVIRGGSYSDKPDILRAGARGWDAADDRESPNVGFRVGRSLTP
jgi:formylglycine-generating enzyme required for sulfatase activity